MSTNAVAPAVDGRLAPHRSYQALVGRLRDLIYRSVPPGATVVVISKGDDELVSLVGRQGWHFPQDDSGGYAGYHPRDSADAIARLEALRSCGADFLVLPATSRWWLDHYADFASHLERNFETLVEQPDTGTIYRLALALNRPTDHAAGSPEHDLEHRRSALLAQQINDLADYLLPAGEPVIVIDWRNVAAVQLDGRRTMHVYPTEDRDGPDASAAGTARLARLENLRGEGAAYLIVTARAFEWWRTDEIVRSHVEQHYRCITRQAHVCLVYELFAGEEAVGP